MAQPQQTLDVEGYRIPVYHSEVSGRQRRRRLRAAVELRRRKVDVLVATQTLFWGTSACSGSDKQTLHTASTSFRGDNFTRACQRHWRRWRDGRRHGVREAVGSVEAFIGLKSMGLPLPEDRYGAGIALSDRSR
jgi:hypothetical protein